MFVSAYNCYHHRSGYHTVLLFPFATLKHCDGQAGQHFSAIYDFARENNVTFVGGADPSVGASGGWVMVCHIGHEMGDIH